MHVFIEILHQFPHFRTSTFATRSRGSRDVAGLVPKPAVIANGSSGLTFS
jgi:hypothetical protein